MSTSPPQSTSPSQSDAGTSSAPATDRSSAGSRADGAAAFGTPLSTDEDEENSLSGDTMRTAILNKSAGATTAGAPAVANSQASSNVGNGGTPAHLRSTSTSFGSDLSIAGSMCSDTAAGGGSVFESAATTAAQQQSPGGQKQQESVSSPFATVCPWQRFLINQFLM